MTTPLIITLAVIILIALAAVLSTKPSGRVFQFSKREPLFTPAERSFLGVLDQCVGNQFRVFGKVRLGDLITPAKEMDNKSRTTARNKANQKHVDFVLCKADTLAVIAAIELDDSSHGTEKTKKRDNELESFLSSAGLTLIRFPAQRAYTLEDVRQKIEGLVGEAPVATCTAEAQIPVSLCPKCGSALVRKKSTKGEEKGREFMACPQFPKCRHIEPVQTSA